VYGMWVEGGQVRWGGCSVLVGSGEAGGCRRDWGAVLCYAFDTLVSR